MILENAFIQLEVSHQGAEMHHLILKASQKDWIWQADPNYWAQRNPILFPIVGSTYDQKIRFEDQTTQLGNHGFARYATFRPLHHSDTSLKLELTDNDETYLNYPFHFSLAVDYCLVDDEIHVKYTIRNKDTKVMPFSFGLHPAFATSSNGVDVAQRVEFSHRENLPNGTKNHFDFTDEFFKSSPTYIMEYPQSTEVTLVDLNQRMTVGIIGYRWLAFWKKPNAAFLCIEPWHGHDDFEANTHLFKDREGTLELDPGHSYTTYLQLKPHQV